VRRVLAENRERLLRFVRRQVGPKDVAEEILHDAIVRGLARADSVRDDTAALAWFYRLLRNATVDHLRSESADRRGLTALETETAIRSEGEPEEDLFETLCTCLTSLITVLKADYATALRRVDLGGESIGRFASSVGISRGNASVRLHRARRALRRAVDRNCGSCAEHGGYLCECKGEPHGPSSLPAAPPGEPG
jgi:RNA polymerase sigma-70 factor (ECF subfamily)